MIPPPPMAMAMAMATTAVSVSEIAAGEVRSRRIV